MARARATTARPPSRAAEAAIAGLGAWTVAVPYLDRPLGLAVDVPARVEIADHVIPGVVAAVAGAWLVWRLGRSGGRRGAAVAFVGGLCFLAGFWNLATHVPLLADAAAGRAAWPAAIWHAAAGPALAGLGLLAAFRTEPGGGAGEAGAAAPPT